MRPRVGGRDILSLNARHPGIPIRNPSRRLEREEKAARRVDVVVFEVETLQPRVLPRKLFAGAEKVEHPAFGNPVHAADELFGI